MNWEVPFRPPPAKAAGTGRCLSGCPESVGIREARDRLAELVDRAERGETVVITRGGREVALLSPPLRHEQRRPGRMKGRMWAARDWDETPLELVEEMEGKGERWW